MFVTPTPGLTSEAVSVLEPVCSPDLGGCQHEHQLVPVASAASAANAGAPPVTEEVAAVQVENKASFKIGPAVFTITGRLARSILLALRIPSYLLSLLAFKSQQAGPYTALSCS